MITTHPELLNTSRHFLGLTLPVHPMSGTEDDDDDRDDEHAGENEAPMRAVDEGTETPEEFEVDDKDKLCHLNARCYGGGELLLIRQSDRSAID